jgi:hypothetical protein
MHPQGGARSVPVAASDGDPQAIPLNRRSHRTHWRPRTGSPTPPNATGHGAIQDQLQRIRPTLVRRHFVGGDAPRPLLGRPLEVPLEEGVHRRVQDLHEERADLRRELAPDPDHPVRSIDHPQMAAEVATFLGPEIAPSLDLTKAGDLPLQPVRRALPSHGEELLFILGGRDPDQRPDLRVGDLPPRHRLRDLRQLFKGPRHPDPLPGGDPAHPGMHDEPGCAVGVPAPCPPPPSIERCDEGKQTPLEGRRMGGDPDDPVAQLGDEVAVVQPLQLGQVIQMGRVGRFRGIAGRGRLRIHSGGSIRRSRFPGIAVALRILLPDTPPRRGGLRLLGPRRTDRAHTPHPPPIDLRSPPDLDALRPLHDIPHPNLP